MSITYLGRARRWSARRGRGRRLYRSQAWRARPVCLQPSGPESSSPLGPLLAVVISAGVLWGAFALVAPALGVR